MEDSDKTVVEIIKQYKKLSNKQIIMLALYKLLNDLAFRDNMTKALINELTLRGGV